MMDKLPGTTACFYVFFKDENNELFDPDSVEATVYKPDDTPVETLTVTRVTLGKYSLEYTLPDDAVKGEWYILVEAVKGSKKEKAVIPINVIRSLLA